ncbi:hypothetical protein C5167_049263 [Papaver somniferum]|uniref:DUF676 domain-containing protein n=1 Tax=Papaver somniferum TaxID=3469 RepID=A0A4Y7KLP9_PAPSO|nr:uncharacterized protein LOC113301452 [Papaver somniferum]RZC73786.1 hypothetical protein C5167_049263 [Papaver somniferum]
MVGANSLSMNVNFGAKEISVNRSPFLRIQANFRTISFCKLGFCLELREPEPKKLLVDCSERKMCLPRLVSVGCFTDGLSEGIWDSETFDEPQNDFPIHLVVMVNGIIGSAADWRYAAEQFVKKLPDKVIVHRSECNSSRLTFDGVDLMGERLAEEVISVVRCRPGLQKISFVAHSLGGLIARYAIGRLFTYFPDTDSTLSSGKSLVEKNTKFVDVLEQPYQGRIAGLKPLNFITFATPHLGSRGHKKLPFLFGLPFLEKRVSQAAHWIVGKTGKHLFLTDNDDDGLPLLLQMVNDCDDLQFISALRSFKRRVAYANANYDHMVGWRTSSIRRQHELPQSNLLLKYDKYPHIVYIEREQAIDLHKETTAYVKGQTIELEEKMIRGLTQVSWERVDVSFHESRQKYVAHSTINVKRYWINSDGADVVFHMIDNFLV